MNNFQDMYRQSVDRLPGLSIDAAAVLDEVKHRKRVAKRRRQMLSSAAVTCSLLFLCGVGSVTAANYFHNIIRVTDSGFASGDADTMEMAASDADTMSEAVRSMDAGPVNAEQDAAATGGMQEETMPQAAYAEMLPAQEDVAADKQVDSGFCEYSSIEDFRANETAALALPAIPSGDIESVNINVSMYMEDIFFLQRMKDGKMIQIRSTYYEDSSRHSSTTVYGDEVTNKREYTTDAGFTYTVIDTMGETDEQSGVHAAIAIGNYEVFADFWGYTQQQAFDMLESMDLSVYLKNRKE